MNSRLSKEEWKELLLANFKSGGSRKNTPRPPGQKSNDLDLGDIPGATLLYETLMVWIYDVMARRLSKRRRVGPLLSRRDFRKLIPQILDEMERLSGSNIEPEDRKRLGGIVAEMYERITELSHIIVRPKRNEYDEYWRWLEIVTAIASERGVTPANVFGIEGVGDEITRRLLTKRQFITVSRRAVRQFVNVNAMKKCIVTPMIKGVSARMSKEERRELNKYIKEEIMPRIREVVAKNKEFYLGWIDTAARSIYKKA